MDEQAKSERILHAVLAALMVLGVALAFVGVEGFGKILFWLSFILTLVIFAGYLFDWVIQGIHGPGWFHPGDYLKKSREARTMLVGLVGALLLWW